MTERSNHLRGILQTMLGVLILTPDSLLIRLISTDPWTLLFWRGLLQCLTIVGFYIVRYRGGALAEFRSIGRTGLVIALLFAGSNILFVVSIRLTLVANTLIIVSAAPLLGALFSRIFLRESIRLRTWIAAILGMAGIMVLFAGTFGGSSFSGDLCALGSACFLAGTFVVIRGAREVNMVPSVALTGLFTALVVLPLSAPLSIGLRDAGLLLIIGAFVSPVSFGFLTLGPRYLPAPEVSLIMLLETVFGPVWVWMVLGEVPPAGTLVGGAIVVGTLVMHSVLALRESRGQEGRR